MNRISTYKCVLSLAFSASFGAAAMAQQAPNIELTPNDALQIKSWVNTSEFSRKIQDGSQHALVDGTALLQFLDAKTAEAQKKAADLAAKAAADAKPAADAAAKTPPEPPKP